MSPQAQDKQVVKKLSSRERNDKEISNFKKEVKATLFEVYGNPKELKGEQIGVVQLLYTKYFDRFVNDNNRIWYTGNLFIPLSLGGLLVLDRMEFKQALLLAVASLLLLFCWVLVAENHRAFQTRAQVVTEAIESYLGLSIKGGKLASHGILRLKLFGKEIFTVQNIRWQMFFAVFIVWALAIASGAYKHVG